MRLYLDLETYRPERHGAFTDERIIIIGLLVDETPYRASSLNVDVDPILLSEWDGLNEKKLVADAFDLVRDLMQRHRFTVICGYNLLRYDIPLLVCRAMQHALGDPAVLSKLWNDCFTIDYFQHLLVANHNRFKGMTMNRIVQVSEQLGLNPPAHTETGTAVKNFYDAKEYAKIERHLIQDLRVVRWLDLYGANRLIDVSVDRRQPLFMEKR